MTAFVISNWNVLTPTIGNQLFTSNSTFTVPNSTYYIDAVCVGRGATASQFDGGRGGNLKWRNNIAVVPGEVLIIGFDIPNLTTHIRRSSNNQVVLSAGNGFSSNGAGFTIYGVADGDGGGRGGSGGSGGTPGTAIYGGGGGAGGYGGNGGNGGPTNNAGSAGAGGGGGGGGSGGSAGGGGGGVGINGVGTSGAGGNPQVSGTGFSGVGGSNGQPGFTSTVASGFSYGGGGGAPFNSGASGAAAIYYGYDRTGGYFKSA